MLQRTDGGDVNVLYHGGALAEVSVLTPGPMTAGEGELALRPRECMPVSGWGVGAGVLLEKCL